MTKSDKEKIKELIRKIAKDYGVDPKLALKVAECESGLDPTATNRNPNGTIDRGLFQWNDYWHPEITNDCAFNVICSTIAFCEAVKKGHLDWWNATRHCWQPAYHRSLLVKIFDTLKELVSWYKKLLAKLRGS